MKYKNWKCEAYNIYGDNTHRQYGYQELKEYFNITGEAYAECIKDFIGNPKKSEYYTYQKGKIVAIDKTYRGFLIR